MNGKTITLRLSTEDVERLHALVEEYEGATVSGLVRAAMRIGLDEIEADPDVLDEVPLDTRGGAREGAGRKPSKRKRRRKR